MKEDERKDMRPSPEAQGEQTVEAAQAEQTVEAAQAEQTAEAAQEQAPCDPVTQMEEVARRVANEEHTRWQAEDRRRRRRRRRRRLLAVVLLILLAAGALVWLRMAGARDPIEVNEQTIPLLSPIDEQAAARIDAMEGYDPEDTWTFYLYLVGSDLEAGNSNQLSNLVKLMIKDEVQAISAENMQREQEQVMRLSEEIARQGLELPYSLFAPNTKLQSADSYAPYVQGDASHDLWEYMSVPLPENVRFVIQTGGAAAWAEAEINPNRTQRFLLDSRGLREIYNGPIRNMGDPDTLADFLTFCDREYPADHQVVIFWDHGGGYAGFGVDQIYGDLLTLPELRQAFSQAFTLDREDPPLEMIYFACCLMSNAEVLDYLDGTARYMVAAEEVTYTAPAACSGWLEQFVQDTGINGAQLGKLMVDHYMQGILQLAEEYSYVLPTTMNLLDMSRAGEVYDAYGDFAQAALEAQIQDPDMVSRVAYAAAPSVFMAGPHHESYNLIDLKLFMENAAEHFPQQAQAVIDAVDEVMLYKRATEYLKDAGGVSIYYPFHLSSGGSISSCLSYINDVSENMDINAMYYYKMAGCLNETYSRHCEDAGYGTAQTLRYDQLYRLHGAPVELDEKGDMRLALTGQEYGLLQDAVYELMLVEEDEILYLGEDRYVDMQPEQLITQFPASWVAIDGVPFALEIINTDEENIQYSTPVEYRMQRADLILNYNYDTQEITVLGVRDADLEAATLDRSAKPLKDGEKLAPIYKTSDPSGGSQSETTGKTVRYRESSVVADTALKDGTYLARIKMEDMRSDLYYGQAVRLVVEGGRVKEAMPETEYRLAKYR